MGYNSVSGLYYHCGLEYEQFPTGVMIEYQSKADEKIWYYQRSPPTGVASDMEADLVYQFVTRKMMLTNRQGNVPIPNRLFDPVELSKRQIYRLIGPVITDSEVVD